MAPSVPAPRRILVIKWGALGDLVASTVALRALRETWPSAHMTALANPLLAQICPPGTLVDEILPLGPELLGREKRPGAYRALIRRLRSARFDWAVNLRWNSERSALLARLSGAPVRAGSGPRALAFLYTHRAPIPRGRRHEFHRHLDILAPLGIVPARVVPFVYRSPDDLHLGEDLFRAAGLRRASTVGMHPGASRPSKAWPAERYGELAARLTGRHGLRVLVTWGPGEESLAREVARRGSGGAVLAPATPGVGALAAVIGGCGLCVCNYSGPMNVAMAVETPLVALGSTSPEDWGPLGEVHRTVNKSGAKDSYTEEEQLVMMERIGVGEVEQMVVERMRTLYGG